nr:START domain-containing protein [Flavihumibacter fluminis]
MKFDAKQDNKRIITIAGSNSAKSCKYTLKKASGYILLEEKGGNTTITYYFHSEPSQKIPTWLINPRIHEMPFQTFVALRRIILLNQ